MKNLKQGSYKLSAVKENFEFGDLDNEKISFKNLEDALNFCEIKSENSLSPANAEEDLIEDTKEKTEKMKDEKEEKVNEEK